MITTSRMTRQELEDLALAAVCPCWHFTLAGAMDETSNEELQAVIADPMAFHYENQKHNPVDEAEFQDELRQCQEDC